MLLWLTCLGFLFVFGMFCESASSIFGQSPFAKRPVRSPLCYFPTRSQLGAVGALGGLAELAVLGVVLFVPSSVWFLPCPKKFQQRGRPRKKPENSLGHRNTRSLTFGRCSCIWSRNRSWSLWVWSWELGVRRRWPAWKCWPWHIFMPQACRTNGWNFCSSWWWRGPKGGKGRVVWERRRLGRQGQQDGGSS